MISCLNIYTLIVPASDLTIVTDTDRSAVFLKYIHIHVLGGWRFHKTTIINSECKRSVLRAIITVMPAGGATIQVFPVRGNHRCFLAPVSPNASIAQVATISTRHIYCHAFLLVTMTILTTMPPSVKVCALTTFDGTMSVHHHTRLLSHHVAAGWNWGAKGAAVVTPVASQGTKQTRLAMTSRRDYLCLNASYPRSIHCLTMMQNAAAYYTL